MTISDLAHRIGTSGLARLLGLLALWLLMHAVRVPFVLVARLLAIGLARLDAAAADLTPALPVVARVVRPSLYTTV